MIEIATLRRFKAQTEFRVFRSTQDERFKKTCLTFHLTNHLKRLSVRTLSFFIQTSHKSRLDNIVLIHECV